MCVERKEGWMEKGWMEKGWVEKGWMEKGRMEKGWNDRGRDKLLDTAISCSELVCFYPRHMIPLVPFFLYLDFIFSLWSRRHTSFHSD